MARKYFTVDELNRIQEEHPDGLTSRQIVELCRSKGMRFSIATLKNYVSRGLLPRAKRVRSEGRVKGKYYTSVGKYDARVIKLIDDIKRAIEDENWTLDEITSVVQEARYDHSSWISMVAGNVTDQHEEYLALRQRGHMGEGEFQEQAAKLREVYRRLQECLEIIGEDRDATLHKIFQHEDALRDHLLVPDGTAPGGWVHVERLDI